MADADAPQAATPGQAAAVPDAYASWYRASEPGATDEQIAADWRIEPAADREFWQSRVTECERLRAERAGLISQALEREEELDKARQEAARLRQELAEAENADAELVTAILQNSGLDDTGAPLGALAVQYVRSLEAEVHSHG